MCHSHSDFDLPGLSSRGLSSWIVATSFAYSGRWNSRNLENHFHGFWNLVLMDLVDDLTPNTIVVPQFQLDTLDDAPVVPDDSIATTAQAGAKEMTPDFAVAVFHLVRRPTFATQSVPSVLFPTKFDSWRDVQVMGMKIPLIAELKRPATRRAESRERFEEALEAQMHLAHADLLKQAEHAFLMQPEAEKVILLACCGEWWSWMVATRPAHVGEFTLPSSLHPQDAEAPEISDDLHDSPEIRTRGYLPREGKRKAQGIYRVLSPSPPSDSDRIPYKPRQRFSKAPEGGRGPEEGNSKNVQFKRYTELGEGGMETLKENVDDATPVDDEWSLPILFGSEASSQRFFLIHRFIEEEWKVWGADLRDPDDRANTVDDRGRTAALDESDTDDDDDLYM